MVDNICCNGFPQSCYAFAIVESCLKTPKLEKEVLLTRTLYSLVAWQLFGRNPYKIMCVGTAACMCAHGSPHLVHAHTM